MIEYWEDLEKLVEVLLDKEVLFKFDVECLLGKCLSEVEDDLESGFDDYIVG